jgi:hypothetical protein
MSRRLRVKRRYNEIACRMMALWNRKPWYGRLHAAPLQAGHGLGKVDLTAAAPRSRAHQRMVLAALTPKREGANR